MTDIMIEIDVDNTKKNELLDKLSNFLHPEVVDMRKMLRDKKQNREKLFREEYDTDVKEQY